MQEPSRTSAACILLLLLLYSVSSISGVRDGSGGALNERTVDAGDFRTCVDGKCIKRTSQEITSGMWFGPRLGRRRRSGERSAMNSEASAERDGEMENLANVLSATDALDGWLVLSVPANQKRQSTSFTPRLGRELYAEKYQQREDDIRSMDAENDLELLRSPSLYSPRLGRKVHPHSSSRLASQLQPLLQRIQENYQ